MRELLIGALAFALAAVMNVAPVSAEVTETSDWGVAPIAELKPHPYHAPTPTTIPGATVVSTADVEQLMQRNPAPVLLNVLDNKRAEPTIPSAVRLARAGRGGEFDDKIQDKLAGELDRLTGGDKARPIITFCRSSECWLSYNAALRALKLGYTNVLWYRGGINAWKEAGKPTVEDANFDW